MLRLRDQGGAEIVPRLHYPCDSERTHPLYRMGQELSLWVSSIYRRLPDARARADCAVSSLAKMTRLVIRASWTRQKPTEKMVSYPSCIWSTGSQLIDIAEEIENLKKEAAAFREVRSKLGEEDGPERVFHKVSCRYSELKS